MTPSLRRITLAYSSHRIETLPFSRDLMLGHELIVLEEPPNTEFLEMLSRRMPIHEYVLGTESAFPLFTERSCSILQELSGQGKTLMQIEPYMEILEEIHTFFEEEGRPEDLDRGSPAWEVYQAERRWTGALLRYYEHAVSRPFPEVVSTVKAFARADSAKGLLRDRMRAERLCSVLPSFETVYVEAGYLHAALRMELRKRLPNPSVLKPVHIMESVVQRLWGRPRLFGPGDLLTLLFTFRPGYDGERADLLAARSLIHVKILRKEELPESDEAFPHTREEIETKKLVEGLSFAACGQLYREIRSMGRAEAREAVQRKAESR